jgi:hypothetical protein
VVAVNGKPTTTRGSIIDAIDQNEATSRGSLEFTFGTVSGCLTAVSGGAPALAPAPAPPGDAKAAGNEWPSEWEMQADAGGSGQCVPKEGLVKVTPAEDEYWNVFDQLRAPTECGWGQMDDSWISSLHRIQNSHLHTFYEFRRKQLWSTVGGSESLVKTSTGSRLQEERVWHGTKGFPAHNIWADKKDGFMMQHASEGQWGRGLYFAKDPGYSHIYASTCRTARGPRQEPIAPDECEMMMATLLLGTLVTMDRNKSDALDDVCRHLKVPPFVNAKPPLFQGGSGDRFDTVCGYTQAEIQTADGWIKKSACPNSKVFIVYENGRAYPKYLLRYYRGRRDTARTPYASRAEGVPSEGVPSPNPAAAAAMALAAAMAPAPAPAAAAMSQAEQFSQVTGADTATARRCVQQAGGDLTEALNAFFSSPPLPAPAAPPPAAAAAAHQHRHHQQDDDVYNMVPADAVRIKPAVAGGAGGGARGQSPAALAADEVASTALPAGWEQRMHDGKPYYVNHHTHTTTWDRPTATATPAPVPAPDT